jgi:FAD/FMN-containing dehydrogenase
MKRRSFIQSSVAAAVAASLPSASAWAEATAALSEVTGDTLAVSGSGSEIVLEQSAVKELSESLRGRLLMPGQEGYDKARRVLSPTIDKYPALIVQPSGAADIMNAVTFARERSMLLAVKCGGHSFAGKSTCNGGMQIDLSTFRNARVDPGSRTAYVAGGSLLGELDHEAMALGLVTTAGTVSHTGVGGLTLGGGFGRLARRYGLALDNVKAVEIVTADGKLRRASADENPDLYWGVRGGGGNFGVVTSFEFELHPMQREVIGGTIIFPLSEMRNVLGFYSEYVSAAPDDLYLDCAVVSQAGSADGIVLFDVCYSGPVEKAESVLAPVRKAGGVVIKDGITKVDYVALQRSGDNSDPRNGSYLQSGFIDEFPAKLVDTIVENYEALPERGTVMYFQHSGGAIGRVAPDATAFAHRKSIANMLGFVDWPLADSPAEHVAYIKEFWKDFEPFTDGWYTNEVDDHSSKTISQNYQVNSERLVRVKNEYDPTNLFRLNANVKPTV